MPATPPTWVRAHPRPCARAPCEAHAASLRCTQAPVWRTSTSALARSSASARPPATARSPSSVPCRPRVVTSPTPVCALRATAPPSVSLTCAGGAVTAATLSIVQVFWGLDKKLAQRKHFPSVNWNISYSKYLKALNTYYQGACARRAWGAHVELTPVGAQSRALSSPSWCRPCARFCRMRRICRKLCSLSARCALFSLARVPPGCPVVVPDASFAAQDSLGEDQKLKLEIARVIREDFLQQNGYSAHDFTCPLVKTLGMLSAFRRARAVGRVGS
jgi:hypothetical protein